MRAFFCTGTHLENNLYESDAVSHQKEDIFKEDWSEFILCDWNQLLGSKVSHTCCVNAARSLKNIRPFFNIMHESIN